MKNKLPAAAVLLALLAGGWVGPARAAATSSAAVNSTVSTVATVSALLDLPPVTSGTVHSQAMEHGSW